MNRRTLITGFAAWTALSAVAAGGRAADMIPFDSKAFAAAQDAGEGIVLFVHAPW